MHVPTAHPTGRKQLRISGMTLIEVLMALAVMTFLTAGILATFIQSRRLTKASIGQNCAVTIVQGYIEQIKNLPLNQFVNSNNASNPQVIVPNLTSSYNLFTMKDPQTNTPLYTTPSSVSASSMLNATPGTTPTGVVDNLESFDLDSRAGTGTTTWQSIWPNANTALSAYPSTAPGVSDLKMDFWVQVTDLTPNASPAAKAYGILIVYTYQYPDGNTVKWGKDSVRTIRSVVQTF